MDEESILEEAERLVNGDRNDAYGPPWEDFARTVAIFNAWTGHDLSPADGIRFLHAVKLSREVHAFGRDNYVDGSGYLDCLYKTHRATGYR